MMKKISRDRQSLVIDIVGTSTRAALA